MDPTVLGFLNMICLYKSLKGRFFKVQMYPKLKDVRLSSPKPKPSSKIRALQPYTPNPKALNEKPLNAEAPKP